MLDMCELARNSVLQSSFEPNVKAFWIGANYWKGGIAGNDIHRTNLPNLRVRYREVALAEELRLVRTQPARSLSTATRPVSCFGCQTNSFRARGDLLRNQHSQEPPARIRRW